MVTGSVRMLKSDWSEGASYSTANLNGNMKVKVLVLVRYRVYSNCSRTSLSQIWPGV